MLFDQLVDNPGYRQGPTAGSGFALTLYLGQPRASGCLCGVSHRGDVHLDVLSNEVSAFVCHSC